MFSISNLHLHLTCRGNTEIFQMAVSVTCTENLHLSHRLQPLQLNQIALALKVDTDEGDMDIAENFSDIFLRNVSLFYLKLQGQFMLPASTIQNIVEEMQNIHDLGKTYTLSKLSSLLKNETPLSDEDIAKVCESVKGFDHVMSYRADEDSILKNAVFQKNV